jgi:hypothetical protein
MPSKKKALAIAKDVLAQLKSKKIKFKIDTGYVHGTVELARSPVSMDKPLQEQIDAIQPECEVCALGGCFLSYIRLYNHVPTEDLLDEQWSGWDHEKHQSKPTTHLSVFADEDLLLDKLENIFSKLQMALIELCFESPPIYHLRQWFDYPFTKYLAEEYLGLEEYGYDDEIPPPKDRTGKRWDLVIRTVKFSKRFRSPEKRIEAIMKNIVRNKGEFIPPKK